MAYSTSTAADTLLLKQSRSLSTTETLTLEQPRQLELKPRPCSPLELKLDLLPAPSTLQLKAQPSRVASLRKWVRANLHWIISAGILGADLAFHAPLFVVGAAMTGITLKIVKAIIRRSPALQLLIKKGLTRIGITEARMPAMTAGVGVGAWLSVAMPSHAMFFQAAENYFTNTFTTTGGGAVVGTASKMVFGVLRVIFVLYLGIALVRVINAFRNDEDWQTAARIPMVVILCIVLGDALSTMIVGNGG